MGSTIAAHENFSSLCGFVARINRPQANVFGADGIIRNSESVQQNPAIRPAMWHQDSYRWSTLFGDGHAVFLQYDPKYGPTNAPDYSFDWRF